MNISLTLTEATELIRQALKIPNHQELIVKIFVESHPYAVALHKVQKEFPRHFAEQKISAIKLFRELVPKVENPHNPNGDKVPGVGLADGKWAVENIETALDNLNKYSKLRL